MKEIQVFDLHPLFEEVQMQKVFPDGKTFVDCIPKHDLGEINQSYLIESAEKDFSLKDFVLRNFDLPAVFSTGYVTNISNGIGIHMEKLWDMLTRNPQATGGSLIALPNAYIVPGGRFGEIFYWDSYFTMLGLRVSKKNKLIKNMIDNFSYLIDQYGYIPNGNRTYFLGRSQPPYFAMMVELLGEMEGDEVLFKYLPYIEKEYTFWMQGSGELNEQNRSEAHCLLMPDGEVLNRYHDIREFPRAEAFRHETEIGKQFPEKIPALYRHLRAAAESGWDFSSRWYKEENVYSSTHTADIAPVDLNCLLYQAELIIGAAYKKANREDLSNDFLFKAEKRKKAIQKYCWNEAKGFYFDYDAVQQQQKTIPTAAGFFTLFLNVATTTHAKRMISILENDFLMPGGVVTTLNNTGQQWDAPNGWAPIQWAIVTGLQHYGYNEHAAKVAERWINMNLAVFNRSGKLMEKYNVVDINLEAGGGEYKGQDGFGWTNGVLLALMQQYKPEMLK